MEKVIQCAVCGSRNFDILLSQIKENIKYVKLISPNLDELQRDWIKCKNCDLVHQTPCMEVHEIDIMYNNNRSSEFRNGETPDEYFNKITSLPKDQSENYNRVTRFSKYIDNKHKNILDIGCGGGVFLYTLSKYFPNLKLFGIEASPQFASLAKSKLDITLYNNFFEDIELDTEIDIITVLHVLEHIKNPKKFLEKIYKIMTNESILIFEVPHIKDFKTLDRAHIRFSLPHIYYYSEKNIILLLKQFGFDILNIENILSHRQRNTMTVYAKKI